MSYNELNFGSNTVFKGDDGYAVLPNGLKMCWGRTAVAIGTTKAITQLYFGHTDVTLPISFNSTSTMYAQATNNNGDYPYCYISSAGPIATNKLRVGTTSDSPSVTVNVNYFIIGY